jgi:hypothetical protein
MMPETYSLFSISHSLYFIHYLPSIRIHNPLSTIFYPFIILIIYHLMDDWFQTPAGDEIKDDDDDDSFSLSGSALYHRRIHNT